MRKLEKGIMVVTTYLAIASIGWDLVLTLTFVVTTNTISNKISTSHERLQNSINTSQLEVHDSMNGLRLDLAERFNAIDKRFNRIEAELTGTQYDVEDLKKQT